VSAILLLILRILMAACLYGFIGLVMYTMLRDLKQQGNLLIAHQPPPITLTSLVDGSSKANKFIKPEVLLGRDPNCDFHLDDHTVSSQHARLSYHQLQWWLEDLASTNGTYLNNEMVTTPVVITQGDELRLGQLTIKIEIGLVESITSAE
jgi:pSer/pThr/pTyr-binding forkhead associated (FHA) protein